MTGATPSITDISKSHAAHSLHFEAFWLVHSNFLSSAVLALLAVVLQGEGDDAGGVGPWTHNIP